MGRKTAAVLCGVAALSMGLTGCAAGEAPDVRTATPSQVANTAPDPWDQGQALERTQAEGAYRDGVYTGVGHGMEGIITVTGQRMARHVVRFRPAAQPTHQVTMVPIAITMARFLPQTMQRPLLRVRCPQPGTMSVISVLLVQVEVA